MRVAERPRVSEIARNATRPPLRRGLIGAALLWLLATCVEAAAPVLPTDAGALADAGDSVVHYGFEAAEDQDLDLFPDDWLRRKGADFPAYIPVEISSRQARSGRRSLRIQALGGQAAVYSPPLRISARHSFVFRAAIRTEHLTHDAAMTSLSFLNARRERLQRLVSKPVSGHHSDWKEVTLGPVSPPDGCSFVVIGCHLASGAQRDVEGEVWFDDLRLSRMPRLSVEGDVLKHIVLANRELRVSGRATGLSARTQSKMAFRVNDETGAAVFQQEVALSPQPLEQPAGPDSRQASIDRRADRHVDPRAQPLLASHRAYLESVLNRRPATDRSPLSDAERQDAALAVKSIVDSQVPPVPGKAVDSARGASVQTQGKPPLRELKRGRWFTASDAVSAGSEPTPSKSPLADLTAPIESPAPRLYEPPDSLNPTDPARGDPVNEGAVGDEATADVQLPQLKPGYYEISIRLVHGERDIALERSAFAVIEPTADVKQSDEFGWSIPSPMPGESLNGFADIIENSGISWVKYPLWRIGRYRLDSHQSDTAGLFDRLGRSRIGVVGILDEPPEEVRGFLPAHWSGVAELFSLPSSTWAPSLHPVIARFAASIMDWQLGGDADLSFVGRPDLNSSMQTMKGELTRLGRTGGFGLPWSWNADFRGSSSIRPSFISRSIPGDVDPDDARDMLRSHQADGASRWVTIPAEQFDRLNNTERAARLARLVVAMKQANVDRIFFGDPVRPHSGLATETGAPQPLWLPWRTLASTLRGAASIGSIVLPNNSQNAVFTRGGKATIVLWSEEPTTETLYLGDGAQVMDLWGRKTALPVDETSGEQSIPVGPVPVLVVGCSESIAKWRIAVKWERGLVASEYGGHHDAIIGQNGFPQGVSGVVEATLPRGWEGEPTTWELQAGANESFKLPTFLRLPPDASLGQERSTLVFKIVADRPYTFRAYCPYVVGLADLSLEVKDRKLPDGRLEIEQVLTNRTQPVEVLNFRCTLFVPGERRQKLIIARLGEGQDRKLYYVSDAEARRGQEFWIRLEQEGGRRLVNYRWKVTAEAE